MVAKARSVVINTLFEQYSCRVYSFTRRLVDESTADDIVQEVFVRLLTSEGIEDRDISISYLLKMAENLVRLRYRESRRASGVPGRDAAEPPRPEGTPAEERVLARALEKLSDPERETLRMIVCEGLSYKNAAAALDVSVSTLNNWKFRAIQKLKDETGSSLAGAG